MINVDTNILLRAVLKDEPKQAKLSQKLLYKYSRKNELFISSYTVLEFVWSLKMSKKTKAEISKLLEILLDTENLLIAEREKIRNALFLFKSSKLDFGDCMIYVDGLENKCDKVSSFDIDFQKSVKNCGNPKNYL